MTLFKVSHVNLYSIQNDTFDIIGSVINSVLNLPIITPFDKHAIDDQLITMLREIGYTSIVASMSKLSRPFLRKEWSFFFDQLSKGFTGKCSSFEKITSLICQIGYNLLFNRGNDIGSLLLNHIGLKLNCANRSKVYYHRFIIMSVNHFIPNVVKVLVHKMLMQLTVNIRGCS